MNKYDFARRLKRIVSEECEIIKAESRIAQKSVKYWEKLSTLKSLLVKQEQELMKYCRQAKQLKHANHKLKKLKQEQENLLCILLQRVEQSEVDYKKTLEQRIQERQRTLLQMDCMHNVKVATQTYINLNALPQFIQGVTVSEKDCSSDWRPFRIDPSNHTKKEVEDMIWHDPVSNSDLKKTWQTILFGEILIDDSNVIKMDTGEIH